MPEAMLYQYRESKNSAQVDLRSDIELLLRTTRFGLRCILNSNEPANSGKLLLPSTSWESFGQLAKEHGLSGLIRPYFSENKDVYRTENFQDFLSLLMTEVEIYKQQSKIFCAELAHVHTLLSNVGIDPICFKGPELALRLYGKFEYRPFVDLDIYVEPDDVPQALKLLEKAGWAPLLKLSHRQLSRYIHYEQELSLQSQRSGVILELHWSLLYGSRGRQPIWPAAPQRCQSLQLAGAHLRVLSPEDQLILLTLHAAKHHWSAIRMSCDLFLLLEKYPDLDFRYVDTQMQALECGPWLKTSLLLCQTLFQQEARSYSEENALIRRITRRFQEGCYQTNAGRAKIIEDIRIRPRYISKLHYFLKSILCPRAPDVLWKDLPQNLGALYYPLRFVRLIYSFFVAQIFVASKRPNT